MFRKHLGRPSLAGSTFCAPGFSSGGQRWMTETRGLYICIVLCRTGQHQKTTSCRPYPLPVEISPLGRKSALGSPSWENCVAILYSGDVGGSSSPFELWRFCHSGRSVQLSSRNHPVFRTIELADTFSSATWPGSGECTRRFTPSYKRTSPAHPTPRPGSRVYNAGFASPPAWVIPCAASAIMPRWRSSSMNCCSSPSARA